jgi:ubiquitin-protein ligase
MSPSTTARLLKEYARESKDPNPAVRALSPVSDENVFTWTGWLRGINGTPYEGRLRSRGGGLRVRGRMAS